MAGSADQADPQADEYGQTKTAGRKKGRIGFIVGGILVYIAFLCDLVELALDSVGTAAGVVTVIIGYLKDIFVFFFFPLAFFILRVPLWKGRKARQKIITMAIGFVVGLVPWLGAALPETTLSVLITVGFVYLEDKGVNIPQISNTIVRPKRSR